MKSVIGSFFCLKCIKPSLFCRILKKILFRLYNSQRSYFDIFLVSINSNGGEDDHCVKDTDLEKNYA